MHIFWNDHLVELFYFLTTCESCVKASCSYRSLTFLASVPTEKCEEVLPVAEAPGPRVLSADEQRRLAEQEENTLRELRLFLRDVTKRLATDKRFSIFSKPVDIEEVWCHLIRCFIQPVSGLLLKQTSYLCLRCQTIWR